MKSQGMARLFAYRWEALLLCAAVLFAWITVSALYPLALREVQAGARLVEEYDILKQAKSLPSKIEALEKRAVRLDNLSRSYERGDSLSESDLVGQLYALGDSAGCTAAKVEIREPIVVAGGTELPIMFSGQGTYGAIGRLVAGVENLPVATRVRQVVLTNEESGSGSVVLDFVVMRTGR